MTEWRQTLINVFGQEAVERCVPERVCQSCGVSKLITAFPVATAKGHKYRRHHCRNCLLEYYRKYHETKKGEARQNSTNNGVRSGGPSERDDPVRRNDDPTRTTQGPARGPLPREGTQTDGTLETRTACEWTEACVHCPCCVQRREDSGQIRETVGGGAEIQGPSDTELSQRILVIYKLLDSVKPDSPFAYRVIQLAKRQCYGPCTLTLGGEVSKVVEHECT